VSVSFVANKKIFVRFVPLIFSSDYLWIFVTSVVAKMAKI